MGTWKRIALALAVGIALLLTSRLSPRIAATLLLLIAGAWLARGVFRSSPNALPFAQDRDFSSRPALILAVKALSFFVLAILWPVLFGLATRLGYLPDTDAVGFIAMAGLLASVAVGGVLGVRALARFMYGRPR